MSAHKRKPQSLGKRTELNRTEIMQMVQYCRTVERDYPRMRENSGDWGRHTRIKQYLNGLYVQATTAKEKQSEQA